MRCSTANKPGPVLLSQVDSDVRRRVTVQTHEPAEAISTNI